MTQITIMRTERAMPIIDSVLDGIRGFLFGVVDGFTNEDKRAWRRMWKRIKRMQAGELLVITVVQPRSGPFHRRHMSIEQAVFDAQERFQSFKAFRDWLKIGSGHCEWVPGPKGTIVPIPNSISYASMDDEAFRVFHENMIEFLRGDHAANILWPHLKGDRAAEMMEAILGGFNE